eukprot:760022-Rhodomonas_salina.2
MICCYGAMLMPLPVTGTTGSGPGSTSTSRCTRVLVDWSLSPESLRLGGDRLLTRPPGYLESVTPSLSVQKRSGRS